MRFNSLQDHVIVLGLQPVDSAKLYCLSYSIVLGMALGEQSKALADGAGHMAHWFASADHAAVWVATHVPEGATVLVKGSRGMALERVVQRLLAHWQEP
jgi:UDP-N-acetylmuramoyl-tripeptide--D-alanyl-D-alanine ligase